MTYLEIQQAIARGIAERRSKHLEKLTKWNKRMENRINSAKTAEQIQSIEKDIEDGFQHHYKRKEKNIEYKHYEDAGYNDEYIETLDELDTKLRVKKKKLGL